MKTATVLIAEQIDFHQSEEDRRESRTKFWRLFAVFGWILAGTGIFAVSVLVPYISHSWFPVPVVIDKQTGQYYVDQRGFAIDPTDPASRGTLITDLTRYVKAHEGFTRGEANNDYATVWLMSSPNLRGQWDTYFKPEFNKRAPLAFMTAADQWSLSDLSISFIPTNEPGQQVAIVRYDLTKIQGADQPTIQRMATTITFKYDKKNIPEKLDYLALNAYGFQALNYHTDPDGPLRQLTTAPPAPNGVFGTPRSGVIGGTQQ